LPENWILKHHLAAACLSLAILSVGPAPASAQAAVAAKPLVAPDFRVPVEATGPGFRRVPLGPALVKIDYDAYMSSIEHLQKTFTRNTAWPHPAITDAEAMIDMETEQARFSQRKSFAYAVLTPDGKRERGCVYVQPSPVPGYGAVVRMWVTKAEYDAGFDAELNGHSPRSPIPAAP
jgi:hypothetical protein